MKVIGLTHALREDADRRCAAGFRAWLAEVSRTCWTSWPEVLRFYPSAKRLGEGEAHFPLASDGTGVRATVIFQPGLMRLRCIGPAPVTQRRAPLSHPQNQQQTT